MCTIMLTCPSNVDPPYTPLLYSMTWDNSGIHFFFFFFLKHRLWVLVRTAQNLCFIFFKKEKYQTIPSENHRFYSRKILPYITYACLRNGYLLLYMLCGRQELCRWLRLAMNICKNISYVTLLSVATNSILQLY